MHVRRQALTEGSESEREDGAVGTGLRAAVCFGTRPEAIKLFPVVRELRKRLDDEAVHLLCTDQHADLIAPVLHHFGGLPIEHFAVFEPGQSLATLASRIVERVAASLRRLRPDVVIVQGDTISTFASALAAFYERIPVVHVEAGIRTHDLTQPYPEEFHRTTTARVAALHLAPTEAAAANLRSEAVPADDIVVTGNTGQDAVRLVAEQVSPPSIAGLVTSEPYAVMTIHRRESIPVAGELGRGVRLGAAASGIPVVVVYHPNPAVSDPLRTELADAPGVVASGPLAYERMLGLLRAARFVVTDSGGIQEEAAALGVPALVARRKTGRHESVTGGNAVLVPMHAEGISEWMKRLVIDDDVHARMSVASATFGDGFASERAVDALIRRFGRAGESR